MIGKHSSSFFREAPALLTQIHHCGDTPEQAPGKHQELLLHERLPARSISTHYNASKHRRYDKASLEDAWAVWPSCHLPLNHWTNASERLKAECAKKESAISKNRDFRNSFSRHVCWAKEKHTAQATHQGFVFYRETLCNLCTKNRRLKFGERLLLCNKKLLETGPPSGLWPNDFAFFKFGGTTYK